MCGIAGIAAPRGLDWNGAKPGLERALDRLTRRGPDGQGEWHDGHCALGHRRLAIVDLSAAGAQPMTRGDLAITFNGMIYNFRGLRAELSGKGHRFESESDTEVLLAGWREWGPDLLPKLVGMFAFAIWDAGARTLWLARDRFGQKPLLYREAQGRLAFASDLKALARLTGERGEIDPSALSLYWALRYVPSPYTILKGFRKLPAGHLARFDAQGFAVECWYTELDNIRPDFTDEGEAARTLADTVRTAVADRLVADVPVGAFLSGGIDSAIVTACMADAASDVRTFTVGFEGVPDYYEERPAARAIATYLGTDHTEIPVGPDEALNAVDAVFDALDEPFADSSAVPTYLVSRETRRHVTVALSGDGGDEIFGGYRKYQGELLSRQYQRIPRVLRRGVIEPLGRALPEGKGNRLTEAARRARRFVAHAGKSAIERQTGWARLLNREDVARLAPDHHACLDAPERLVEAYRARAGTCGDPINIMLAGEIGLGLEGDMLVKVDRTSMAHGLEVRSPFLDHRVAACAARMPGRFKLKRGSGKHVLREAFRGRLPAALFNRPKKGFEVPIAEWLTGPLRERTLDAISPDRLAGQGLFDAALPAAWFKTMEGGRRDTSAELWTMIAFQAWWDAWWGGP